MQGLRWQSRVESEARGDELVVDGEVGLPEGNGVESRHAEAKRSARRGEVAPVTQDVLDIFAADVATEHDLVECARDGGLAEELDEEGEPDALAINGA